jgi:hypothetical protein
VAIVPPERMGKMDRNDCHTAWGKFKTLISSLHHYKNNAWFFSFIFIFLFLMMLFFLGDLVSPSTGCKSQLFNASGSGNRVCLHGPFCVRTSVCLGVQFDAKSVQQLNFMIFLMKSEDRPLQWVSGEE